MQAQATHLQSISSTQSLASVKTLLTAGLGCITYLRNLLPTDNFTQSHFTSSNDDSTSESSTPESREGRGSRANISAFKIMTLTRGFTEEADKLLNYMEYGIFDALQKQYLRTFILAVHLDDKDPNNIVEAYTFHFQYHTIPGTNNVVPVMTLGEDLENMSLNSKMKKKHHDPVTEAITQGKAPTILDVKKSVKALLKRLIHATTQMDPLPKRRYATFKITYTDKTPADYEPPNFQAGDSDKDRWFFTTHTKDEVPEKWVAGSVDTGHHSVAVNITSVTTYLPSITDDNNATFTGMAAKGTTPSLTPVQEATMRAQDADMQMQDAESRIIAWAVDDEDADAEGDDDPDYVQLADGTYELVQNHTFPVDSAVPIGRRNSNGDIEPFTEAELLADRRPDEHFSGVSETVPLRVGDMHAKTSTENLIIEQTQVVDETQALAESLTSVPDSPLPPSDPELDTFSSDARTDNQKTVDADVEMTDTMQPILENTDTEMLDLETQIPPTYMDEDPIESFEPVRDQIAMAESPLGDGSSYSATPNAVVHQGIDTGLLRCECESSVDDESCFCDGGCGSWYHLWCMGFHSQTDKRIPERFICFDCRVRSDPCWELIELELYPKMISKFKELALFRRAIKIAEVDGPETPTAFSKAFGCNFALARQLFNRLETEGFVSTMSTEADALGLLSTVKAAKSKKGKQAKARKTIKSRYVFNKACKKTPEYADYFNPDQAVESRMLGLADMKASFQSHGKRTPMAPLPDLSMGAGVESQTRMLDTQEVQSQTQDETQRPVTVISDSAVLKSKRANSAVKENTPRPAKKMKISVTAALDLAE